MSKQGTVAEVSHKSLMFLMLIPSVLSGCAYCVLRAGPLEDVCNSDGYRTCAYITREPSCSKWSNDETPKEVWTRYCTSQVQASLKNRAGFDPEQAMDPNFVIPGCCDNSDFSETECGTCVCAAAESSEGRDLSGGTCSNACSL